MRVLLAAVILLALPTSAQDAELIVTFERTTPALDAARLVRQLGATPETAGFSPTVVGSTLDAEPASDVFAELFATGALSVTVTRPAAVLATLGAAFPDLDRVPEIPDRYAIRVEYPNTVTTDGAVARFQATVGVAPTTVESQASELRVTAPTSRLRAIRSQLRSRPEVVGVRSSRS